MTGDGEHISVIEKRRVEKMHLLRKKMGQSMFAILLFCIISGVVIFLSFDCNDVALEGGWILRC